MDFKGFLVFLLKLLDSFVPTLDESTDLAKPIPCASYAEAITKISDIRIYLEFLQLVINANTVRFRFYPRKDYGLF